MQSVFKEITDDFERQSGHKLLITYATMGAIGESADLVVGLNLVHCESGERRKNPHRQSADYRQSWRRRCSPFGHPEAGAPKKGEDYRSGTLLPQK